MNEPNRPGDTGDVLSAYLDLLLEEMWRLDTELVEFANTLPEEYQETLNEIILTTVERRCKQATAAYEMIKDD